MDKTIALYLLKIFALIWQKYFQPNVTAVVNTAVQNRLATLINAVKGGSVPKLSWANALKHLKLDDNSVVRVSLSVQKVWTSIAWEADIAIRETDIAALQAQAAAIPKPKVIPDQETLDFYNSNIAMIYGPGVQGQIIQAQDELDEMKAI